MQSGERLANTAQSLRRRIDKGQREQCRRARDLFQLRNRRVQLAGGYGRRSIHHYCRDRDAEPSQRLGVAHRLAQHHRLVSRDQHGARARRIA